MAGDFRDVTVDGWAVQMMGMPARWYAEVYAAAGIEYPVNADESLLRRGLATK